MNASMRARVRRFVDLTVKWISLLGMLFLAEYSVNFLLEFYKGGNKSTVEIAIFLVILILYGAAFALLTMFYPTLQSLLDNMFGDARAPDVDGQLAIRKAAS